MSSLSKEIVDRIVAERQAGASLYAIKDHLNAEGIKGSGGGTWYASTVRHVLLSAERERGARQLAASNSSDPDGH